MPENEMTYRGVIVPMVTPLLQDLRIDENAVARIMKIFGSSGVAAFLLGTTGESQSISKSEKVKLVDSALQSRSDNTAILAGIASNCISESIEDANTFSDMGVDAMVTHLPYFYPISTSHIKTYFEQIADNINCPLMIYNMPGLVGRSIPLEIIEELSHHPNIIGFKDSERDTERLDLAIGLWKDREDFSYLLGWAAKSAYACMKGCHGIVPSTGNVSPGLFKDLYDAAKRGDESKALRLQDNTDEIAKVYQENRNITQSIPALKQLMSEHDLCQPYVLPPIYMPGEKEKKEIKAGIGKLSHIAVR